MLSSAIVEPVPQNRRLRYRQKLRTLAYLKLDSGNGGVIRDVSETGIAVQLLTPLRADEQVHVGLELPNPRLRFEAEARVAWTDSLGQAGLEFSDLVPRSWRLLKEWLFTQILQDAHRASGDDAAELLFSSATRPAIRLEETLPSFHPVPLNTESPSVHLLWFNISALRFSRFVDGTALLCAVLLFSLLALFFTDILPSWPFTLAFVLGVGAVFGALYWLVFAVWFGVTPGSRLAELAGSGLGKKPRHPAVKRARFR
ncbi:MAG TPA: PilZ domain-containing protein [Terriglobales bacterium]|nr:PilZ domain-containing protein [Terriglobales bacterium]